MTIKEADRRIYTCNKAICDNICNFDATQRGLLSQNILAQLRNFLEAIFIKSYLCRLGDTQLNDYDTICKSKAYVKTLQGNYRFLNQFYKLLQISVSHYTLEQDSSERLMLKYYEYLFRIKCFMKDVYNMELLDNLNSFPVKIDQSCINYYKAIKTKLEEEALLTGRIRQGRFYIEKQRTIILGDKLLYEITLIPARDKTSKFNRVIAFSNDELSDFYAVELSWVDSNIQVLNRNMPIMAIVNWHVSIRTCELKNFARIFDIPYDSKNSLEYSNLMKFLTETRMNLIELLEYPDKLFDRFLAILKKDTKNHDISNLLQECRPYIKNNIGGSNVIRYLLYRLNNRIIKRQYSPKNKCELLSNLNLKYGCIPFDRIPFNFSLVNHNPSIRDLFDCIDPSEHEEELLARLIKNNTEQKGMLYTPIEEVTGFECPEELVQKYNDRLYMNHQNARIEIFHKHFYIKEYEDNVHEILQLLKKYLESGVKNYQQSIDSWLKHSPLKIDCNEKIQALERLFKESKVAFIYGAAGTGKSTMINYISSIFKEHNKIFLANTNPAVDNLKRKVSVDNAEFMTVKKYLSNTSQDVSCDILCLDECSTISNQDMVDILRKNKSQLLLLVGDKFQIESILFGNWFSIAYMAMPKKSVVELKVPYRTQDKGLLDVWEKVRLISDDCLEFITRNHFSSALNETIFSHTDSDEIILCLNYDGLYGINNINKFLQNANPEPPVIFGALTYKVGDPILFNESNRFAPVIYNNLKGRILKIEMDGEVVYFTVEINLVINELDVAGLDLELLESVSVETSVIRFKVTQEEDKDDEEDDDSNVIPFQVAYAVSIHKAQGLEYDSVKVVITSEVEEMISHNIFYTAITRAKSSLQIYWSPETENRILGNMKQQFNNKDYQLLKAKFSDL